MDSAYRLSIVILCMLFASSVTSCSMPPQQVAEPAIQADQILWLPQDAAIDRGVFEPISITNGRNLYIDGSASVSFTITGERDELSHSIVQHFADRPWRQRPTQYLNPGLATSFSDGWRHSCGCVIQTDEEGNPIPREPYYDWHGEWEDASGNIVAYSLSGMGRKLRGYAAFLPKRLIDATRPSR